MKATAEQLQIPVTRWKSSRLYRASNVGGGVGKQLIHQFDPERDIVVNNEVSSFDWKPWLTTLLEEYYETGQLHVPDDCQGGDLLLTLDYFGILYTPSQLVFETNSAYHKVRCWSDYLANRQTLGNWVAKRIKQQIHYSVSDRRDLPDAKRVLIFGTVGHPQEQLSTSGKIDIQSWVETDDDSIGLSAHRLFNTCQDSHQQNIVAESLRTDFCEYLENLFGNEIRATFDVSALEVLFTKSQEPGQAPRAILTIEFGRNDLMKEQLAEDDGKLSGSRPTRFQKSAGDRSPSLEIRTGKATPPNEHLMDSGEKSPVDVATDLFNIDWYAQKGNEKKPANLSTFHPTTHGLRSPPREAANNHSGVLHSAKRRETLAHSSESSETAIEHFVPQFSVTEGDEKKMTNSPERKFPQLKSSKNSNDNAHMTVKVTPRKPLKILERNSQLGTASGHSPLGPISSSLRSLTPTFDSVHPRKLNYDDQTVRSDDHTLGSGLTGGESILLDVKKVESRTVAASSYRMVPRIPSRDFSMEMPWSLDIDPADKVTEKDGMATALTSQMTKIEVPLPTCPSSISSLELQEPDPETLIIETKGKSLGFGFPGEELFIDFRLPEAYQWDWITNFNCQGVLTTCDDASVIHSYEVGKSCQPEQVSICETVSAEDTRQRKLPRKSQTGRHPGAVPKRQGAMDTIVQHCLKDAGKGKGKKAKHQDELQVLDEQVKRIAERQMLSLKSHESNHSKNEGHREALIEDFRKIFCVSVLLKSGQTAGDSKSWGGVFCKISFGKRKV